MKRFGKWWAKRAGRNFIKRLSNGFNNPHHREVLKKTRKGGISRVAHDPVRRIENLQFRKGWFLISPKSVFVKFLAFSIFVIERVTMARKRLEWGVNDPIRSKRQLLEGDVSNAQFSETLQYSPGSSPRRLRRLIISFNLISNRRLKKTQSLISRASCLITHPNRTENSFWLDRRPLVLPKTKNN